MESTSLKYHQGLDFDLVIPTCSLYGGGVQQTAPAQYYGSNAYSSSYDLTGLSGVFVTPCSTAEHPQTFTSQTTDLCDLDLIYLDRQPNIDDFSSQQRRESFSSSCESSSSTGSSPPPATSMHQMRTPAYTAYEGYSYAYNSGCSTGGHTEVSMRGRTRTLASGNYPYKRQNKKERQLQMEHEERELTQNIAQLRGVLNKLQRKYAFLEQRVKSRIPQATQPDFTQQQAAP